MTHADLCNRAVRWLLGAGRCNVAFSGIASTREIPDAIGWSTSGRMFGSHVVECKTSVSDFLKDGRKHFEWQHLDPHHAPPRGFRFGIYPGGRFSEKQAAKLGYEKVPRSLMGSHRWFMCLAGVLLVDEVAARYPDHGLLWVKGRSVLRMREAKEREPHRVDTESEIRLLQFALVHVRDNMVARDGRCDLNELVLHPMTVRRRAGDD